MINAQIRKKQVHRLAYSSDVAAGQLAVFQGASEAPIPPHFCLLLLWPFRSRRKNGAGRVERATQKNSQLAAAQRVALKMGRRLRCSSVTSRTILIPPEENKIWRSVKWCGMRPPPALPAAHFERNDVTIICETVH
jgi:hypothetical protein